MRTTANIILIRREINTEGEGGKIILRMSEIAIKNYVIIYLTLHIIHRSIYICVYRV